MEGIDYRLKIPGRIDKIIQATVDKGIFSTKSDLIKAAVVKYLDEMKLLDKIKSSIEKNQIDD